MLTTTKDARTRAMEQFHAWLEKQIRQRPGITEDELCEASDALCENDIALKEALSEGWITELVRERLEELAGAGILQKVGKDEYVVRRLDLLKGGED